MSRLGLIDHLYYKLDQYNVASMIMGGVSILAPATSRDKLNADDIASHLAARLEQVPLLRQKMVQDPLHLGSVRRVDDPDFDVWDHITVESVAKPGGYPELTAKLSEISSRPLELDKLWSWTVLSGLEGGRLATVARIHHSVADGLGITKALSCMFDKKPVSPAVPKGIDNSDVKALSQYTLLAEAVAESSNRLLKTIEFVGKNAAPMYSSLLKSAWNRILPTNREKEEVEAKEMHSTSLNVAGYTGKRSVSYKELSLKEIKALAKHFDCKVNDVCLLLNSYAMENYFNETGETVDFNLRCVMPISVRKEDSAAGSNQVTGAALCLYNTIADPVARLKAINVDTLAVKKSNKDPSSLASFEGAGELLIPAVLDVAMFLMERYGVLGKLSGKMPVNGMLSNVPGPPATVYIANGKMEASIPLMPCIDILAVSAGIISVADSLSFGFHCDAGIVRDPELFVEGVEIGLKVLRKAAKASVKPKSKVKPKSTKPKAKAKAKQKPRAKVSPRAKTQTQKTKTKTKAKKTSGGSVSV